MFAFKLFTWPQNYSWSVLLLLIYRIPFTSTPNSGVTRTSLIFQEGGLGLIHRRPSYQPIGTHLSTRSVLVWRSATRSSSLSSTCTPSLCIPWLLTGITAPLHWALTRGRLWLAPRPHYSSAATKKVLMLHAAALHILEQELVSLGTTETLATTVTPESGLVQQGIRMIPTRVGTWQNTHQITETSSSKPWATS